MLVLLAQGASTRAVAGKMAYSEGTVRVYLHRLYRAIGVRNRTEAVLWYLDRGRAATAPAPAAAALLVDESFGDAAVREGLLATLGIMESFLGPYGRMWQAAARLKGATAQGQEPARGPARLLWRALLDGDFAFGKQMDDLRAQEPPKAPAIDDLLLALLLELGGYSRAADRLAASLARARPGQALTARDVQLLRTLRDVLHRKSGDALASLQRMTTQPAGGATLRQMALVALFHVARAGRDHDAACSAANALWTDAEAARAQLEAMGVRLVHRPAAAARSRQAGSPESMLSRKAEIAR